MPTHTLPSAELLKEIEEAFLRYQNESGGKRRHWPEALKLLAMRAIAEGHSPRVVAKAAGVSRGTIVNWCTNERPLGGTTAYDIGESVVELKLIEEQSLKKITAEVRESANARILFLSGIVLEFPVPALTAELLATLNEVRS